MRRSIPIVMLFLCGADLGLAQSQGIRWQRNPPQAIAQAGQSKLPLMFYILSSSKDRDNNLEGEQRRAMTDPRVVRLSQRFIPVYLSRSANRDLLEQLGLPARANMEIAFVSPDGKLLDRLSPGGVSNSNTLAQKMALVFNFYRQQMFDTELRPVLEKKDATAAELRQPLERIRDFIIAGADSYVIKVLERDRLDRKTAKLCCEVLAALSTEASVKKLLALSVKDDRAAADALSKCTPIAAEMMLDHLITDEGYIRLDIYQAITKICGIRKPKSDKWWERAKEELLEQEIERVTKLVTDTAALWKSENEEYR